MPQHSSGDLLADRRYRYAEACLGEGDPAGAVEMAEQALELAPRYAAAWLLLGRARDALSARTGDPSLRAAAAKAFACALDIDPDDRLGARADLARLGAGDGLPALSPAYLRALFDGYAPRFEHHLVGGLGYVGPALLEDALPPGPFPAVLDLGCGTGLMGAAIRDRAGHLAGVDIAPAMLALARAKGCYDRLAEGELAGFLAAEPAASADLCLAADVFIYVADLRPVLGAVARTLRPGGLAAFTVQSPADGETRPALGPDGRYAHADAHIAEAAVGFAVRTLAPAAVRREGGLPVPGRVVVLARTSS